MTSVSHKITAKCGILCPKTLPLTEKQLHAIHFFLATRNVCPPGDPIIMCAKQGSPITGKSFIFHYCDSHFHIVRRLLCSPKCNTYNAEMVESWTQVARNETILSLPISTLTRSFGFCRCFSVLQRSFSFSFLYFLECAGGLFSE